MTDKILFKTAQVVINHLKENSLKISTAESCTGGFVASTITSFSGVSAIYELGVVSYSCNIKNKELGVSLKTLKNFGAISKETAIEMAEGVRKKAHSDFGLSVTGVAGPNSSEGHPAGYVYICVSSKNKTKYKLLNIEPKSREFVRKTAAIELFKLLAEEIEIYI